MLADLNGDGRDDHVQVLAVSSTASSSFHLRIAVSGQIDSQPWQILDVARTDQVGDAVVLRRPGRDALATAVRGPGPYYDSRELILYSGIPLLEELRAPLGDGSDVIAIGDIDSDGVVEVIESGNQIYPLTGRYVRSRNLGSGQIEWTVTSNASRATLAQLDGDVALEIVLNSSPGLVVDGSDGMVEWSYAGGFDDAPLAGNLDANQTSIEFISVASTDAVVFSTSPYSPVRDFPLPCCPLSVGLADFDADGVDEFVVHGYDGVRIFPMLGGSIRFLPFSSSYNGHVLAGQVDMSAGPDLILTGIDGGAGYPSSSASVSVLNAVSGAITARTSTTLAQPMPLAVEDIDGDGQREVVALEIHYTSAIDPHLSVRSLQTGQQLRRATVPTPISNYYDGYSTNLIVQQVDLDNAKEVVFGLREVGQTRIHVVDGLTLATQHSLVLRDAQNVAISPTWIAVADVDIDGQFELVVVTSEVRAYVFDLATGAMEWRSTPLPATSDATIDLIQSDSDAAIELLVGTGNRLFAFDGQARTLDWSLIVGDTADARVHVDTHDGTCRLAVKAYPGRIFTASCAEREFVEVAAFGGYGRQMLWVGWPDASNDLVATDGRALLHWNAQTQAITELGLGAGENAGARGKGLAWVRDGSTIPRLVIASDGDLASLVLRAGVLFTNGFE